MSPALPNSTSPKKEKILIIEGHVTFGQQVADLLNKEGYEAILIKNGSEALKMIYDRLPRLIVLNAVMPDVDSYTILEKKNAEPLLKKIPVFLTSTQGVPISMRRIPQGSVAEFVLMFKADPVELVNKIKKFLTGGPATKPATGTVSSDVSKSPYSNTAGTTNSAAINSTPKSKPIAQDDGKKKILWVEDDKLIGNILGKKLVASGFNLIHVIDGEEALVTLQTFKPDAIVLDILLPGMGGLDILQKIDMNPEYKKIPVMILSNLDKQSDRDKAKMLGAKKYLVKAGTSLDDIAKAIKDMCN